MKSRFSFLLRAALFFIAYFLIARLFFHLCSFPLTKAMGWSDFFMSYLIGLRLDGSMTGYIMMLLAILMPLSLFIPARFYRNAMDGICGLLIALFSLIIWADGVLYIHWGFRIDTTPLMYLATPKDAMASVHVWQLILLFIGWASFSAGFIYLFRRLVSKVVLSFDQSHWAVSSAFVLFAGCMILPVRGSVGIAPINTGMVYFSSNLYTNHSTVNAVWNFLYDMSHSDRTNLKVSFMPSDKAIEIRDSLVARPDSIPNILTVEKPNVLIILLEGVCAQVIEPLGGRKGITPNINKLWNESLAFNHIYASGTRSDRGIVAVLSGYPSHPLASLMKYPKKTQKVNSITRVMRGAGYSTSFYYGGDTDFANMNSYLKNSGFQRVVNQDDFPREFRNSKWGVHDGYMFEHVMADIDSAKAPFFKTFFTLSSHEPFDVPMKTVIKGDGADEKYMNSVAYTDSCLGHFIDAAKQKEWWNNTLVIIVSDHNVAYVEDYRIDEPRRYHIPMIWTGGALKQLGQMDVVGSQCDIAATLVNQLNLPSEGFPFSSNLFTTTGGNAMYLFNKGFGYITPKGNAIYDLNVNKFTEVNGDTTQIRHHATGLFQAMIDDFNSL